MLQVGKLGEHVVESEAADVNARGRSGKGVNVEAALPPESPAILIAADEADGVHWRVGYNNFFVITRYNHSALYAMAVYELAAAVKQRMIANDAGQLATASDSPPPTTP